MEVSVKMSHARQKHRECIKLLKGLWKMAEQTQRDSSSAADELISFFVKTPDVVLHTQKCYEELLVKFPGSIPLLREYAGFCEVVLCEFDLAAKYINTAEILEAGETTQNLEDVQENKSVAKSTPSSTMSHRSLQRQFVKSWAHAVLATQRKALLRLKVMVLGLGFFLLAFSLSGFVILDVYLLSNISENKMGFLDRTMSYLQTGINACIYLRNLQLLNLSDSSAGQTVQDTRVALQNISAVMSQMHSLNYVSPPSQQIADFFLDKAWIKSVAVGGEVGFKNMKENFWNLLNEFISSILASSKIDVTNLQDPNYAVQQMNLEKRAVVFIFDNFLSTSNALQEFYGIMLSEIGSLQFVCDLVVYTLLGVSLLLICFISWAILRNVKTVFPSCQHFVVGSDLMSSLPGTMLQKVHTFYLNGEKNLAMNEDEAAAKEYLEHADVEGAEPDLMEGAVLASNVCFEDIQLQDKGSHTVMSRRRKPQQSAQQIAQTEPCSTEGILLIEASNQKDERRMDALNVEYLQDQSKKGVLLSASGNHHKAIQNVRVNVSSLKKLDSHLRQGENGRGIDPGPQEQALKSQLEPSIKGGKKAKAGVTFRRSSKANTMLPPHPVSPAQHVGHANSEWPSIQGTIDKRSKQNAAECLPLLRSSIKLNVCTIDKRSTLHLRWYLRTGVHKLALLLVVALCCCVWLLPVQRYPLMINIATLIRGVRRTSGVVLLSIFTARELILADGFSRKNTSALYEQTALLRSSLLDIINAFRFGGYIPVEKNTIRFGADLLNSAAIDKYKSVMYEDGCPWRRNSDDCLLNSWPLAESEGLYRYLLHFHKALGIILSKYEPDPGGAAFSNTNFDKIVTNANRTAILTRDRDVQFILEGQGKAAVDGINMLVDIFQGERIALLDSMHRDLQLLISVFIVVVVIVFYWLLYLTAIRATDREIEKTRTFVNMLPVHILTREDLECVMHFFLPPGMDEDQKGNI